VARFVVTTRRELQVQEGKDATALGAVSSEPGVKVVGFVDPHTVTIETDNETADRLRKALVTTHNVEPEIRRGLH